MPAVCLTSTGILIRLVVLCALSPLSSTFSPSLLPLNVGRSSGPRPGSVGKVVGTARRLNLPLRGFRAEALFAHGHGAAQSCQGIKTTTSDKTGNCGQTSLQTSGLAQLLALRNIVVSLGRWLQGMVIARIKGYRGLAASASGLFGVMVLSFTALLMPMSSSAAVCLPVPTPQGIGRLCLDIGDAQSGDSTKIPETVNPQQTPTGAEGNMLSRMGFRPLEVFDAGMRTMKIRAQEKLDHLEASRNDPEKYVLRPNTVWWRGEDVPSEVAYGVHGVPRSQAIAEIFDPVAVVSVLGLYVWFFWRDLCRMARGVLLRHLKAKNVVILRTQVAVSGDEAIALSKDCRMLSAYIEERLSSIRVTPDGVEEVHAAPETEALVPFVRYATMIMRNATTSHNFIHGRVTVDRFSADDPVPSFLRYQEIMQEEELRGLPSQEYPHRPGEYMFGDPNECTKPGVAGFMMEPYPERLDNDLPPTEGWQETMWKVPRNRAPCNFGIVLPPIRSIEEQELLENRRAANLDKIHRAVYGRPGGYLKRLIESRADSSTPFQTEDEWQSADDESEDTLDDSWTDMRDQDLYQAYREQYGSDWFDSRRPSEYRKLDEAYRIHIDGLRAWYKHEQEVAASAEEWTKDRPKFEFPPVPIKIAAVEFLDDDENASSFEKYWGKEILRDIKDLGYKDDELELFLRIKEKNASLLSLDPRLPSSTKAIQDFADQEGISLTFFEDPRAEEKMKYIFPDKYQEHDPVDSESSSQRRFRPGEEKEERETLLRAFLVGGPELLLLDTLQQWNLSIDFQEVMLGNSVRSTDTFEQGIVIEQLWNESVALVEAEKQQEVDKGNEGSKSNSRSQDLDGNEEAKFDWIQNLQPSDSSVEQITQTGPERSLDENWPQVIDASTLTPESFKFNSSQKARGDLFVPLDEAQARLRPEEKLLEEFTAANAEKKQIFFAMVKRFLQVAPKELAPRFSSLLLNVLIGNKFDKLKAIVSANDRGRASDVVTPDAEAISDLKQFESTEAEDSPLALSNRSANISDSKVFAVFKAKDLGIDGQLGAQDLILDRWQWDIIQANPTVKRRVTELFAEKMSLNTTEGSANETKNLANISAQEVLEDLVADIDQLIEEDDPPKEKSGMEGITVGSRKLWIRQPHTVVTLIVALAQQSKESHTQLFSLAEKAQEDQTETSFTKLCSDLFTTEAIKENIMGVELLWTVEPEEGFEFEDTMSRKVMEELYPEMFPVEMRMRQAAAEAEAKRKEEAAERSMEIYKKQLDEDTDALKQAMNSNSVG